MPRLSAAIACAAAVALAAPQAFAEQQARSAIHAKSRAGHGKLTRTPQIETAEQSLAKGLQEIWAGRGLRRGTTAVYVVDANTGEKLFAAHEDRALNPASNVKLVSTATALHVLGPDWTYATQLLGPQPNADGVAAGDIYLYGNSDPTLRVRHLETFAADLLAAGVRKIEGSVLLSDDALRDTVGRPTVLVRVTGTDVGKPPTVTLTPPMPMLNVVVEATTSKRRRRPRLNVATQKVKDENGETLVVRVTGQIRPGKVRKYRRKISPAALFTGHALRGALAEAGVEVTGGVRFTDLDAYVGEAVAAGYLPVELTRRESAPLSQLVAAINKPSNNFLADRLLMTVGAVRYGGAPSLAKGADAMNEWLTDYAGIEDVDSIVLDTGSGLSYKSRISSKQIVRVLRAASGYISPPAAPKPTASLSVALDVDQASVYAGSDDESDIEQVFHESLAVAGVDGTLRRRFKKSPLKGLLVGKTGTLTSVIALSGFVTIDDDDDDAIAFSFVSNGHRHGHRFSVRNEHARMARVIYDYMQRRHAEREQATPRPPAGTKASPESTRLPE